MGLNKQKIMMLRSPLRKSVLVLFLVLFQPQPSSFATAKDKNDINIHKQNNHKTVTRQKDRRYRRSDDDNDEDEGTQNQLRRRRRPRAPGRPSVEKKKKMKKEEERERDKKSKEKRQKEKKTDKKNSNNKNDDEKKDKDKESSKKKNNDKQKDSKKGKKSSINNSNKGKQHGKEENKLSKPEPLPDQPRKSAPTPASEEPVRLVLEPDSTPAPKSYSRPAPTPYQTPNPKTKLNLNPADTFTSHRAQQIILDFVNSIAGTIDNSLFVTEVGTPSTMYKTDGLLRALEFMSEIGVAGMYFYLGDHSSGGYRYGLTNVAAFLAQSIKETIKYDACSENNWDLIDGAYPLSNACGQLNQSYQDYKCPMGQEHMECEVDPNMAITAVTHATWYGAPAPFFCRPKKYANDFTGKWDYGRECNAPWATPPTTCDVYPGQKAGGFDNTIAVANRDGRSDTEGCCWWGRGVIQTTGVCNFGKLNYYLGKRAADEGRITPYGEIDFCKDPEAICSSTMHTELRWIAGMFYWMESVQTYNVGGWNYIDSLQKFVDGGLVDRSFINAVSGIVNRGCHNPPCGGTGGVVDGGEERNSNFVKAITMFKLTVR